MKSIYQAIVEFASLYDGDVELRTDYSGRGMYGRTCVGLITYCNVLALMLDLGSFIRQNCEPVYEISELLNPLTDSMGRSTIIYFPGVTKED